MSQEQIIIKFILKERVFEAQVNSGFLKRIDQKNYFKLMYDQQYQIQSDIKNETLLLFINYITKKQIPMINDENISEFESLSNEFKIMEDVIQIYKNQNEEKDEQNKEHLKIKKDMFNLFQSFSGQFHELMNIHENFKFILNDQILTVPQNFHFFNEINSNIIYQIIQNKQYTIQSKVGYDVFQSFVNYLSYKITPNITNSNIYEYEQLHYILVDLLKFYKSKLRFIDKYTLYFG